MASTNLRSAAFVAIVSIFIQLAATQTAPLKPTCSPRFQWEDAQLTEAAVTADSALFGFDDGDASSKNPNPRPRPPKCKVFPGDAAWPPQTAWNLFNQTLGGALIKTVPLAAPCYNNWPQRDAAKCQRVIDNWADPHFHVEDPTSAMFPLYQGRTCMPTDDPTQNCTLGGYASYSVAVTKVSQIQLALNFARNTNIRLVVKNTGHDFADKSIGAGALSIWTHKLKDIRFESDFQCGRYRGPAFRLGSGVETEDVYRAAEQTTSRLLAVSVV